MVELSAVDDILLDCQRVGRRALAERTEQRRRRGLAFCSYRVAGEVVANSWIALGTERFLDEAMLVFRLRPDMACLRDAFVAPERRGSGVFAAFVAALESGPCRGCAMIWSCVEAGNAASCTAHRRGGFEIAGHVTALSLFDRLLWRRAVLPAEIECTDFEADSPWLWLGARARDFRRTHLA